MNSQITIHEYTCTHTHIHVYITESAALHAVTARLQVDHNNPREILILFLRTPAHSLQPQVDKENEN